ncbi:MAG TPA: hypothetical protein VFC16_06270 [Nakamurella sp.]|nr:hypothetical protein [Nakamurella sp.]
MANEASALFSPGSSSEGGRIAAVLRKETVGGALLLAGTVLALIRANSRWLTAISNCSTPRSDPPHCT